MLFDLVIWLLAVYGCSFLLASLFAHYLVNWMDIKTEAHARHFIVLLRDSEDCLEHVMRRLLFASKLNSQPIRVSFIDFGSTDHTLRIAEKMKRDYLYVVEDQPPECTTAIQIDLRRAVGS